MNCLDLEGLLLFRKIHPTAVNSRVLIVSVFLIKQRICEKFVIIPYQKTINWLDNVQHRVHPLFVYVVLLLVESVVLEDPYHFQCV